MGIDFSISCPAISIINIEQSKVLYVDNYKQKGKPDFWERLTEIRIWMNKIFDTFKPEYVIIEGSFMSGRTARSNPALYKGHGYIGHFLKSKGAKEIYVVLPSSSRSFLKIKPNDKETGFKWVQNNFPELGLTDFKKENDISDAVIVALNVFNKEKIKKL